MLGNIHMDSIFNHKKIDILALSMLYDAWMWLQFERYQEVHKDFGETFHLEEEYQILDLEVFRNMEKMFKMEWLQGWEKVALFAAVCIGWGRTLQRENGDHD